MKLKSYYSPTRDAKLKQTVQIRLAADAAPAAPFVALGDVIHEPVDDNLSGAQKTDISHVLFQHVQEQVYKQFGIQDMGLINIVYSGGFKVLNSVYVDQGANRLGLGIENTITVRLNPTDATTDGVVFNVDVPELVTVTANTGNGVFKFKGIKKGWVNIRVRVKGTQFEQIVPVEFSE